jgi:hypothetical protein
VEEIKANLILNIEDVEPLRASHNMLMNNRLVPEELINLDL